MKKLITLTLILLGTSQVHAGEAAQKSLVAEYIKVTHAEQMVDAEIGTSVRQLTANSLPEQKAQIERYYNESVGWNVIKDQYAEIVGQTYTASEIKAALVFLKTPIGNSITKKNIEFTQKMTSFMTKNMLAMSVKMAASQNIIPSSTQPSGAELVTTNVEEHSADGKTYFTGVIENPGKNLHRGVQLEINLFMAGKFVDQYSTYISGSILPDSQRYFKVSCGCKDSPPAQHDSYKVLVIEGY